MRSTFTIKKENKDKAKSTILKLSKRMYSMMGKHDNRRAWLNYNSMKELDLNAIFQLWECQVQENTEGDIIGIEPSESRVDDLDLLFTTIGCHVESGSYIEMVISSRDMIKKWEFIEGLVSGRWVPTPTFQRTIQPVFYAAAAS